jgi:hypothetical protein
MSSNSTENTFNLVKNMIRNNLPKNMYYAYNYIVDSNNIIGILLFYKWY